MSIAKKLFGSLKPNALNKSNYPAYTRSAEEQYLQTLLTNTMSNTFYADRNELLSDAAQLHYEMADANPSFMAKAIVFARNKGWMRLQPLFGLAVLSVFRPDLFAKIYLQVVRFPSDLSDFLTILKGMGRGEGGRAVKRQVGFFLAGVSEYWAIKYNGRGRGYSLGDAIATAHGHFSRYIGFDERAVLGDRLGFCIGLVQKDAGELPVLAVRYRGRRCQAVTQRQHTDSGGANSRSRRNGYGGRRCASSSRNAEKSIKSSS